MTELEGRAPLGSAGRVRDETTESDLLGRLAVVAIGAYLAVMAYLMILAGIWPTLDLVAISIAVVAVLIGRGRLFFRDWLPFVLIFLAWEAMRGLADNFGAAIHSDAVIGLERLIMFGIVPTVELQRLWFRPDAVTALDVGTSLLYTAHFVFPLGVAFVFWLRERRLYYQFASTLLLMALAAFVVYLLLPVAPPRFADRHGEDLMVYDVIGETIRNLGLETGAGWVYSNLSPNDNAAFPSLHAAFPLLAFLFLRERYRAASWLIAGYTLAVWFAIVYLGHHYVVDVLGGAIFALGAYWLVRSAGLLDRAVPWLMHARIGRRSHADEPDAGAPGGPPLPAG